MVDGEVASHRFDAETSNGFVVCQSGSIWYLDWDEKATLQVNSFHSANAMTRFAFKPPANGFAMREEGSSGYVLASASEEGVIKVT